MPFFHLAEYLSGPLGWIYTAFWVWMLVHCIRNDPERGTWLWLLIILQGIGPVIYFFARYLPGVRADVPAMGFFKRFTSGRQLARLEHAAKNIGNAHQWLELADLQREIGKHDQAAQSYRRALQKDPTYLPALWGAAQSELVLKQLPEAREHLQVILGRDFSYKFGDVSLAYGRVLVDLNEKDVARSHLVSHLQRWTHPEAHLLMARVLLQAGDRDKAREHLETLLADLSAAPAFFARQHAKWGKQARSLLRTLNV